MRDLYVIVADGQAAEVVKTFLGREQAHQSLETGEFDFDPDSDLLDIPTNDPGVFATSPDFAHAVLETHQNLVVLLDEQWENKKAPGAKRITADLTRRIKKMGWPEDRFRVIVMAPELECWIWQDNPHVASVFGFDKLSGFTGVRAYLEQRGLWNAEVGKPHAPKETLERLCREARTRPDRHRYAQVVSRVNVSRCDDPAFQQLRAQLQVWFPSVVEEVV